MMTKKKFQQSVSRAIKTISFKYLKNKVKSKGAEIEYGNDLKCQSYLLPNNVLSLDQQLQIFMYRVRMNHLQYNFKGNNIIEKCLCEEPMNNEHLYYCKFLNQGRKCDIPYNKIFNGTIFEQREIVIILNKNMTRFEMFSQAQD